MLLIQIWDAASSINYAHPLMTLMLWLLLTSEARSPYLSQWTWVDIHGESLQFSIANQFASVIFLFHFHIPFEALGSSIHSILTLVSQMRRPYLATLFFQPLISHLPLSPKEARNVQCRYLCIYFEVFMFQPLDWWHHLIICLSLTPCLQ